MNKVTKEWLWLLGATVASLLCVVALIAVGVKPVLSLPRGIYFILAPVALVYLVRLAVWAVGAFLKKARTK